MLDRDDDAISIRRLDAFSHRIRSAKNGILGWYVASMLLTGKPRVCRAAHELLLLNEDAEDLDLDLSDLSLDGHKILFLCRKIIGYCLSNRSGSAALLLSCMRAIPDDFSMKIERTVFDYFLINYPVAIDWFEEQVSTEDPAQPMVTRLSNDLRTYLRGIQECGTCKAFWPSERQRRLQDYRQMDMWRTIQRDAYERSIASYIAQKSTVLYGTGSIYYLYIGDESTPRRQVSSFASHRQEMEVPRLEVLDPVGLDYAIGRFQIRSPLVMKLLFVEYLASLRERGELDAIMPDLLSEIGWSVISRPAVGTTQHGVDVTAVGPGEDGVKRLHLISIKSGNLTRSGWDSGKNAVRPSLNQIQDVYIPHRIPKGRRNYNYRSRSATITADSLTGHWMRLSDSRIVLGSTSNSFSLRPSCLVAYHVIVTPLWSVIITPLSLPPPICANCSACTPSSPWTNSSLPSVPRSP